MGFLNILRTLVTGKDERDELKKTPRVLPEGLKPDITFQPSRDTILQPSEQEKFRPDIFDLSTPQTYEPEMTVADVKELTYGNPASRTDTGAISGILPSQITLENINRRENKDWKGADRDKDFDWKDILGSVGIGALEGLKTGDLSSILGSAIGTGILGSRDRNFGEKWWNKQKLSQEYGKFNRQSQAEKAQQDYRARDAQINTIPIDDENRRLQIETQREIARERTQSSALSKLNALKVFDPSNAAHRALAEQAGQDPNEIKGWDLRNPVEHSVGGVRFRLNRDTGRYEETNLPKDEEKALVDFKTKDGKTYRVSARTAATLQTQFDTLGMRQEFQSGENEKQRAFTVQRDATAQKMRLELAEHNAALKAAQDATDDAQKQAAELRVEQSKNRLKQLEHDFNLIEIEAKKP